MQRFAACALVVGLAGAGCSPEDPAPANPTGGSPGTAGSGSSGGSPGTSGSGGLPEGNSGIAAKYPGDVGIGSDPDVIFADDFESYAQGADLNRRWDAVYQNQYVGITTDARERLPRQQGAGVHAAAAGRRAQSDATDKMVSPEHDVLFLRYYSKFQPPYDVVGSSHNGSSISAHYFMQRAGDARRARRTAPTSSSPTWRTGAARRRRPRRAISTSTSITRSSAASRATTSSPPATGHAQHEPAVRLRPRVRRPARRHARARPLVLLRVHGAGEHARAARRPHRRLARRSAGRRTSRICGCATSRP